MKNLLNRVDDIDKLEKLPSRIRMTFRLDGRNELRKEYHQRHDGKSKRIRKKIQRIIDSSIGQKWDDVYSKLCKIRNEQFPEFDVHWAIEFIKFPIKSSLTGKWQIMGGRFYGKLFDLDKEIERVKNTVSKFVSDLYYVEPETGILCCIKAKRISTVKNPRKEAERKKALKRSEQEQKKLYVNRWNTELKFINDEELFNFYLKLLREYNIHLANLEPFDKPYPLRDWVSHHYFPVRKIPKSYGHWQMEVSSWKLSRMLHKERKQKAEQEITSIEEKLNKLINGDLSVYYESNDYLYTLQKECHHYGTP